MMEVRVEAEMGRAVCGRVGPWQVLSDGEGQRSVLWLDFFWDFCISFIFSLGPPLPESELAK